MKKAITFLLSTFLSVCLLQFQVHGQSEKIDEARRQLAGNLSDTGKMVQYGIMCFELRETNPDSSFHYASLMYPIAQQLNLPLESSFALAETGYALITLGNFPRALQSLLKSIEVLDQAREDIPVLSPAFENLDPFSNRQDDVERQKLTRLGLCYAYLGIAHNNAQNYRKAVNYTSFGFQIGTRLGNNHLVCVVLIPMGRAFVSLGKPDSALWCFEQAQASAMATQFPKYMGSIMLNKGRVYLEMHKPEEALAAYRQGLLLSTEQGYFRGVVASAVAIAGIFQGMGRMDSVMKYLNYGLENIQNLKAPEVNLRLYKALAQYYTAAGEKDSVVKYQSLIIGANEILFNAKQAQEFQNIEFNEQQKIEDLERAELAYRSRMRTNGLLGGLGLLATIMILLWRNNRQRIRANQLLQGQKNDLETTLVKLQSTQTQLVHAEKMASLGELTAGIAHEIQNPLNFVNNFSELNKDLIEELQEELKKGDIREASSIAENLKENEDKINLHGRRADGIVKSMLQHSRSSSGQKEPTDVNNLVDEYVRLTYHGFRAKHKDFNVKLDIDLDPTLPQIPIVAQDIGRVILNLLNNAFQAVQEKAKTAGPGYQPTISIKTHSAHNEPGIPGNKQTPSEIGNPKSIAIAIADNGPGIPESIKDKIFQPFFTTKPTGQGTGLGLSLSYDIVKAHGGLIELLESNSSGTAFKVQLPAN
ncbi:MAG: ATP-binding protein [Chitinophagaceae bacterium]|jgi:signal transduction histidine kinase|nr:ATP-binding protein [Chitinophagaceae bacterium]